MKANALSVSQITELIKSVIESNFYEAAVFGEISNYKAHSSGHRYFALKDEKAQISCVVWRGTPVNFEMSDGMKVAVVGYLTVYPPRGSYQMVCESVSPLGVGELYLAFEALKKKLAAKGYFDESRKKPLPRFPKKIGVATSPTGAAIRDILSVFRRRFPCEIYFRPTLVQGENAARDIVKAIKELEKTDVEAIIVGRGGGSIEDLWPFNEEIVADAIYKCSKPVVSAVGHETDFTIADFTADKRAATPTAAAEILTQTTIDDLTAFIEDAKTRLKRNLLEVIDEKKEILSRLASPKTARRLADKIKTAEQRLDELVDRLSSAVFRLTEKKKVKAEHLEKRLRSVAPLAPLERGYALLKSGENYIEKDETIGNYIKIDILRKNEIASVYVSEVKPNPRKGD